MDVLLMIMPLLVGLAGIAYGLGERSARKQMEELDAKLDRMRERAIWQRDSL